MNRLHVRQALVIVVVKLLRQHWEAFPPKITVLTTCTLSAGKSPQQQLAVVLRRLQTDVAAYQTKAHAAKGHTHTERKTDARTDDNLLFALVPSQT